MIEKESSCRLPEEAESVDGLAVKDVYYVYVIRSINYSKEIYIGFTKNLRERFVTHNNGGSSHTAKYKPWSLISYTCFSDQEMALKFEKYLKSQSGRAFIYKRLIASNDL